MAFRGFGRRDEGPSQWPEIKRRTKLMRASQPPIGDVVPPNVAVLLSGVAQQLGTDEFSLLPMLLSAMCAMTGPTVCLDACHEHDWRVSPRLWSILIGASASGKSAVHRFIAESITCAEGLIREEYEDTCSPAQREKAPYCTIIEAAVSASRHAPRQRWQPCRGVHGLQRCSGAPGPCRRLPCGPTALVRQASARHTCCQAACAAMQAGRPPFLPLPTRACRRLCRPCSGT